LAAPCAEAIAAKSVGSAGGGGATVAVAMDPTGGEGQGDAAGSATLLGTAGVLPQAVAARTRARKRTLPLEVRIMPTVLSATLRPGCEP
jgi:hypothetical protein